MSDEQREPGRDASAPADRSPTDHQHPGPAEHAQHNGPAEHAGSGPYSGPAQRADPAQHGGPGQHFGPGQHGVSGRHGAPGQHSGSGPTGPVYPGSGPHGPGGSGGQGVGGPGQGFAPPHAAGPQWPSPPPYSGAPTAPPAAPRKQRAMTGIVAAALLAGVVGGGAGFGGAYALLGDGSATPQLTSAPAASNAANVVPGSVAAAAAVAMPSTVDIRVAMAQGAAEGSGVVLTADGHVLTNNHVVAGSTGTISVTLADGSEHPASVVGTSPSYDLAVIKIEGVSGLTPATLGRSGDVQVGQQVVAIGSPQGLSGTVTTGIVSAFDRTVQVQGEDGSAVVYNGLQTDAPINQGNSGGPLVNLEGQVVGINSAIATAGGQSSGSIGLGFAIPVDQARRIAQEIMETGTATKPVLGVQGNARAGGAAGAPIAAVQEGSPAAQAGLVAGDVVTEVDGTKVEDFSDLIARIGSHTPGEQISLTVGSGGGERTVDVTLGSQPDRAATTSSGGQSRPFGDGGSPFGN